MAPRRIQKPSPRRALGLDYRLSHEAAAVRQLYADSDAIGTLPREIVKRRDVCWPGSTKCR